MHYKSKYFLDKEFVCKCGCGTGGINPALLPILDDVREKFGVTTVNSGVRCAKHNKAVGGAPKSQHVLKNAADIKVRGVKPEVVHAYLIKKYPDSLGIGLYNSFVHVDVRPWKARWDLSDKGNKDV